MLTLTTGLSRELKVVRLAKVRQAFAIYFGFTSNDTIATAQNYANTTSDIPTVSSLTTTSVGNAANLHQRFNIGRGDPLSREITKIFLEGDGMALAGIDTDPSYLSSPSIASRLNNLFTVPSGQPERTPEEIANFSRFVTIFYSTENSFRANARLASVFHQTLDRIGFNPEVGNNPSSVNEQESKKKLSAFMMKHPILVPSEKNADLLSVFFNAMPALELTRATPVMNIRIFSKKQVFQSDENGRLSAVSLPKFLEGAVNTNEGGQYSVLRALALANQVTSSQPIEGSSTVPDTTKDFQYYSISGMELFQSPQTLVNPDAAKIRSNFLAPPIDPFRPLATIKSFDVDVKSTGYGLISTKQSKLEIVLHDRSRLGEFADIVKPDRFGNSFLEVEYGWSHPDAVDTTIRTSDDIKNPFADLLNLTRSIDHYSVVNSSFSFDEVGQVTITLNLMSRGVSEMAELSITGEQNELRAQLEHIRVIAETITQLTSQVYRTRPDGDGGGNNNREEIRGHQMLGAAGDATNFLMLTPELISSYRQLQAALLARGGQAGRNSAAIALRDKIETLVGPDPDSNTRTNSRGGQTENGGFLGQVRRTVNNSIRSALGIINRGTGTPTSRDTFFAVLDSARATKVQGWARVERQEGVIRTHAQATADDGELANIDNLNLPSVVSLGTIIMSFIAKPLAGIKTNGVAKFKEVQVYFYAFNTKAGHMSKYNIAQFPIYTKYFAREYSRYRLQTAGRSATVSITEFMTFLHDKIIDDTMNPAYGVEELYKRGREGPEAKGNADTFDREMRRKMIVANIGGSPDFQMPMLTYDIESCPYDGDNSQTILKIHVVDRTNSARNPLRELLTLSINDTLSSVTTFPSQNNTQSTIDINEQNIQATNNGHGDSRTAVEHANDLRKNWTDCYGEIQRHALALDLIEDISTFTINNAGVRRNIAPSTPQAPPSYRFKGGSDRLKSMVMEYTPHIIYGAMNTTIKQASLSTQANAALSTINMLRAGNADAILATGEQAGGVPMQIYPVQLSLTTLGCPFIRYSQELFVDFNTNTTADNLYYVTSIQHRISSGEFTTTLKLTPSDAFPAYRNFIGQLNDGAQRLSSLSNGAANTPPQTIATGTAAGSSGGPRHGGGHGPGNRQGHGGPLALSQDTVRAAQQRAARERVAERNRRDSLTDEQRREEDARRAGDNQIIANSVIDGAALINPEAVAARAQEVGSAARTRTAAAAIVTGLSTQQTNGIDNAVARNWRRMHNVQANGNTQFQNDEEQRQQRENRRITEDGAYARYAQMVTNNPGTQMLTPSEWLARGRPQL